MEMVLQDIPNVLNFYNDAFVFADSFENLILILDTTFKWMRSYFDLIRLNIFASSVELLGHTINDPSVRKSQKHQAEAHQASTRHT